MKVASPHQLQQLEHARKACDLILINVRRAREFPRERVARDAMVALITRARLPEYVRVSTGEELDAFERVTRDAMVALITLKAALQED